MPRLQGGPVLSGAADAYANASGGMVVGRVHAGWLARIIAVLALLTSSLVEVVPAIALPGIPAPFDPSTAQAFLIQGDSGTNPATFVLQHAQVQADGAVAYVDEGTVGIQANGIGFNPADGFVYATTYGNATPANTLIRIGRNGVWEVVKTPANANCTLPASGVDDYLSGTVVGGFYYAFLPAVGATTSFTVQKVDLATCTRTTYTVTGLANPPSTVSLPFDITFADGFFWGVNANGFLLRLPLSAGAVQYTNVSSLLPSGNLYGAAWTMGNGNPVFQNNATGDFFQLDTTPILSSNPPVLISRVNAPTNSQNDGTFVPGLPVDLSLDKQSVDLYQAPQQVTFTFSVHNNGPDSSSGAIVQDQLPNGMSFVSSSTDCFNYASTPTLSGCVAGNTNLGFSVPAIAAGATYTFTVTVSIAAGTTGSKTNTATVVPNDNDTNAANNTDSTTLVPGTATITLDKNVASITDSNGNGLDDAGDVIHYTFLVTNTSPVPIVSASVSDTLVGTVSCPSTSLTSGASTLCTGSYPITQADVNAGTRSNTATASATTAGGIPTNQPSDSTTTPLDQVASIDLTKTPNRSTLVAGQTVTYSFVATNTGTTTLGNVQISEGAFNGLGGAMSAPTGCTPALGSTLQPGASMTCTATYVVSQADVDRYAASGTTLDNTASVVGTPPTGPSVTDTANASVAAVPAPAIDLTKSAGSVTDTDANGTDAGDTIAYSFSVQNTGNVTLNPVTVSDPLLAGQGITISCPAGPLAPGATVGCTASDAYQLTQGDIDAGTVGNTATATGTTPSGGTVTDPSSTSTPLIPSSQITLIKAPDRTTLVAGQTVTYTFTATNTGTTTLTDVLIAEGAFNGLGAPMSPLTGCTPALGSALAPGATLVCTATYLVTQADVDRFAATGTALDNTASAIGTPPAGPDVTDSASSSIAAPPTPSIDLAKSAGSVTDTDANGTDAGDNIAYSFSVRNTGNVTLSGIAVSDPTLAGQGITIACAPTTLAPGQAATCTASAPYTLTQADIDSGILTNTATASGTTPSGVAVTDPSSTSTPLTPSSSISLSKTADRIVLVAGETITYKLIATNTGATSLADVQISEGSFNGLGGPVSAGSCAPALGSSLAPGQSMTCTATYLVAPADVARLVADGTRLTNTAAATGTPPSGPPVTGTDQVDVPATAGPALALDKSVAAVDDVNGNGLTDAGDEIHYEFLVTNTGTVTLTEITIYDPMLPLVICEATTLAPGASTLCRPHATYVITQTDVDAGGVRNTATASGETLNGIPVTTPPDSTNTATDQRIALDLEKRAAAVMDMNGSGTVDAGDQISYDFVVTNVGTVTMSDVAVDDPKLRAAGISITCPPEPLAANGSTICVADAPYVVTAADVAAGGVHNVATSSGTPPSAVRFVSPPADNDVPIGAGARGGDLGGTGLTPGTQWLALLGLVTLGLGAFLSYGGRPRRGRP